MTESDLQTPSFDRRSLTTDQWIFLTRIFNSIISSGRWDRRLYRYDVEKPSGYSLTKLNQVKHPTDLYKIKNRLSIGSKSYDSVDAFVAEIDRLVVNTELVYGIHWPITKEAKDIRRRVLEKLNEGLPKRHTLDFILDNRERRMHGNVDSLYKHRKRLSSTKGESGKKLSDVIVIDDIESNRKRKRDTEAQDDLLFLNTPSRSKASRRTSDCNVDLTQSFSPLNKSKQLKDEVGSPPPRVLQPGELEEVGQLVVTLKNAVNRMTDAHPEMVQKIAVIERKLQCVINEVNDELDKIRTQLPSSRDASSSGHEGDSLVQSPKQERDCSCGKEIKHLGDQVFQMAITMDGFRKSLSELQQRFAERERLDAELKLVPQSIDLDSDSTDDAPSPDPAD